MTWVKLDDSLHGNRKICRAWKCRPALGLHLMALSYCGHYLTDGEVDREFVEQKLPTKRERERVVGALVEAGLWRESPGGWEINDWLEFNKSRAQVEADRQKDSARKKSGSRTDSSPSRARAGAGAPRSGTGRGLSVEQHERLVDKIQSVQAIFKRFGFDVDEVSVLNALERGRGVDGLDHEDLARKCAQWCREHDRPPAATFHTFIDRELSRLAETRQRERDKPKAAAMVPGRRECIDCGTEIKSGSRCRDCDRKLEEKLTGGVAA